MLNLDQKHLCFFTFVCICILMSNLSSAAFIQRQTFSLKLNVIAPDSGNLVMIFYKDFSDATIINDTLICTTNPIEFKGTINYPHLIRLIFKNKQIDRISDPFFINPGNQEGVITITDSGEFEIKIMNNKTQLEYETVYRDFMKNVDARIVAWYQNKKLMDIQDRKFPEKVQDSMITLIKSINSSQDSLIAQYIKAHPNSYVGLWMLIQYFNKRSYKNVYYNGFGYLSKNLKEILTGTKLRSALIKGSLLAINSHLPEIRFKNLRGYPETLSYKKYKYTIIDFWFSYCGPCIEDFNKVAKYYHLLDSHRIQFVAVSVDKSRDIKNLKHVLHFRKYPWKQLLDENGTWSNTYNITTFPFNIVVDSNGLILAKDINPEYIESRLLRNQL